jgi:hypothetical protein
MQLVIENVKTNPSGKSCVVKAGGKDYFAKPAMGLAAGMTIEAETEVSEFNGKQNTWIKAYKKVGNGSAAPQSHPVTEPRTASSSAGAAVAAPAWLPFASNTVAHAINGGLITTPDQVKLWAAAAKQAFIELA